MSQEDFKLKEAEIETQNVTAGLLNVGDIIFVGGVEYDVIKVNNHESSFIKVRDRQGKESDIYSYDIVKRAILK